MSYSQENSEASQRSRDQRQLRLWMLRHGETKWSKIRHYTGLSDIPLTDYGCEQAQNAQQKLSDINLDYVFSSPLIRAQETASLAGVGSDNERDLSFETVEQAHEWNYGDLEGIDSLAYASKNPDFDIWQQGAPGGESVDDISLRADQVISHIKDHANGVFDSDPDRQDYDVLLVAHGHFIRVCAARFLKKDPDYARDFVLDTIGLCLFQEDLAGSKLVKWNI